MYQAGKPILNNWPDIREDLKNFLLNQYGWITENLEEAYKKAITGSSEDRAIGWKNLEKLIEIMKMLEDISDAP